MPSNLYLRSAAYGLALALTLAVSAPPALAIVAVPSVLREPTVPSRVAEPIRLGYSAVLHDEPRLNYEIALGLSYGLPLAILFGSQGLRASNSSTWDMPVLLTAFGSMSAGYVYVGEPMRGLAVLAGEGAVAAATVVAYSALKKLPGAQSAQLMDPPLVDSGYVALPLVALIVCEIFKAHDLRRIVDEKNRIGAGTASP